MSDKIGMDNLFDTLTGKAFDTLQFSRSGSVSEVLTQNGKILVSVYSGWDETDE